MVKACPRPHVYRVVQMEKKYQGTVPCGIIDDWFTDQSDEYWDLSTWTPGDPCPEEAWFFSQHKAVTRVNKLLETEHGICMSVNSRCIVF